MMKNLMPQTDTPDNAFHDGDPLTGELGTVVTALFMNNVQAAIRSAQAEILAVLADAGMATDVEKSDQLLAALKKTFASSHSPALQGAPTAPTQPKADNSTKLATTAHVKSVAADYAPLVNPALTGKPTAPTAAQTANDTQLATTAFVKTALAALVANALAKKQPLDATLTALAGLAGGANRLPYFTGADTVAQTDLTQIGRDILAKTTVAAVLQYLGLQETGTSGVKIPLLSTANTWNARQTFSGGVSGSLTGNADTATKLATPRKINGVPFDGSADISVNTLVSRGRVPALSGNNQGTSGIQLYEAYGNGYPTPYGNVIHLKGASAGGEGELLMGWSGVNGAHAPLYIRSRRDFGSAPWCAWAQVLTSNELTGIPLPFPGEVPPTGWLKCNGQAFNKTTYPVLASLYPTGKLPDLRGEFIRGWDDGRKVDTGRSLLSEQGDAIRNITGTFDGNTDDGSAGKTGAFYATDTFFDGGNGAGGNVLIGFDASRVVPTATENRPRNIAFNYIVRAA